MGNNCRNWASHIFNENTSLFSAYGFMVFLQSLTTLLFLFVRFKSPIHLLRISPASTSFDSTRRHKQVLLVSAESFFFPSFLFFYIHLFQWSNNRRKQVSRHRHIQHIGIRWISFMKFSSLVCANACSIANTRAVRASELSAVCRATHNIAWKNLIEYRHQSRAQ